MFLAPTAQEFTHRKHKPYGFQKVLQNLLNNFLHKIDGMNDHIAEDMCKLLLSQLSRETLRLRKS